MPHTHLPLDYFTDKIKQPGKKATYYKRDDYTHEGYEWQQGNTKLVVGFQLTGSRKTSSISIYLERK